MEFHGVWAKQLVRAFTNRQLSIPIALDELKPLQSRWQKSCTAMRCRGMPRKRQAAVLSQLL
jgi:hypothetical protein